VSGPCPGLTRAGRPCQRYVKAGATFCFCHDPDRQAERDRQRANLKLAARRALAERAQSFRRELLQIASRPS